MEPFVRLLESPAARLTTDDVAKAARFCRRLLGPSNKTQEQARALQFILTLKRVELIQDLQSELQQLSDSEQSEIASAARQLISPAEERRS